MAAERWRGVAWAFGSALASALFVIPWKVAGRYGASDVTVLLMLTCAALFNSALVPLLRRPWRPLSVNRSEIVLSVELAVLTLAGNWASAAAIQQLSPAVLSVLQRSEVLVVALLAWALLGERVDGRFWLGVLCAGLGLWLMRRPEQSVRLGLSGAVLGMLSASAFGTMAVLTRKHIRRIDPPVVNALRLWLSVGLWFAVFGLPPMLRSANGHQLLFAALSAAIGPGFARLALMYSARHIEARLTALTVLTSPLVALLLAYVLLGDVPARMQLWGGALMLLGVAVPLSARLRWPLRADAPRA